jgi:hypothetical protein
MSAAERGLSGFGTYNAREVGEIYQAGRVGEVGLWQNGQYILNPLAP